MNNEFPIPIKDESDLTYYEKYLEQEFPAEPPITPLYNQLNGYIGKAVRVDLFSPYRNESRSGILTGIGQDFLALRLLSKSECFIPLCALKSITILQNNKKLPHF